MDDKLNIARALKARLDTEEEARLSPLACFSSTAQRRHPEPGHQTEYRQNFSRDADRILHSLAYTRYIDKTQVFSLIRNDHLTHRVLHVQMVSRAARTIGRCLDLNVDLIEAAALGHDIGHPPFGHDGERILSRLTRQAGAGSFHHNVQSLQFLEHIERNGKGWNLSLQTLDAILCHDGETHNQRLSPLSGRDFAGLDQLISQFKNDALAPPVRPMTLEGCVVRMADTISYIGRDLEDAIRLNIVTREQIPEEVRSLLGSTNGTMVFNLVTDLIANSQTRATAQDQASIGFSAPVAQALARLKRFNYQHIYKNPVIKRHLTTVEDIYHCLFERFLKDVQRDTTQSPIFKEFLTNKSPEYRDHHAPGEIVRDFISGMTDSYFIRLAPESMRPRPVDHV
ncbi:MAG: HD domain-containing protein [Desulfobacterales bacterium]|nr:HD domain-containing protein [Desulfobacterales bacterium]